jgi:hypothetical protein
VAALSSLLSLIIGLLLGFYGRAMYDRLNQLHEEFKDRREAKEVGVVRPIGIPATKNQPIDLSSDTGGVRKPTPAEVEDQRQTNRARVLQENHR